MCITPTPKEKCRLFFMKIRCIYKKCVGDLTCSSHEPGLRTCPSSRTSKLQKPTPYEYITVIIDTLKGRQYCLPIKYNTPVHSSYTQASTLHMFFDLSSKCSKFGSSKTRLVNAFLNICSLPAWTTFYIKVSRCPPSCRLLHGR